MVDFNALIVWKTFIDICVSIKSCLWALTAAYTKFRRMIWSMIWSYGHHSRSLMCTVTSSKRRESSLGKSWKHTTLWFPGGSSHYTGAEAQFWLRQPWRNLPLFFPPSSLRLLPLSLLTRVWDTTNCGIKMFVGIYVLQPFDGLMRLIIFPWN